MQSTSTQMRQLQANGAIERYETPNRPRLTAEWLIVDGRLVCHWNIV